jgi:LPXTG-motif cell wall-anchored protein
MKRILAAVALAIAAVISIPTAAYAYGELAGPSQAAVGATATYTATNIPAGVTSVDFTVSGAATLAATISKTVVAGAASTTATFPSAGTYTIGVTGGDGPTEFSDTITVLVVAPAGDKLPNTGSTTDAAPILWFGSGLVLLGALAVGVFATVRRSNKQSA